MLDKRRPLGPGAITVIGIGAVALWGIIAYSVGEAINKGAGYPLAILGPALFFGMPKLLNPRAHDMEPAIWVAGWIVMLTMVGAAIYYLAR